ncbi:MAG TPA: hypothetical protein VKP04_07315 [Ktedonobacteraceae bacterium]|nr:hypothetical protein [Ktedonobacteraceae bacterium]
MRYRGYPGYRRRRWRRGIAGFPFVLILMIFLFSHAMTGMMIGIGVIILISLLARFILPAIFGVGMRNGSWMNNQQGYRQQQNTQYYQPPNQPYEESYQPYEQGYQYQPPAGTYQANAEQPQYQPPSYEQSQYEEQPKAQYPQEMPPMQQH